MDSDIRHYYLYAKGHYKTTDIVNDLSVIYRYIYSRPEKEPVPINYLIKELLKLVELHVQQNQKLFSDIITDILPESTWRHGYFTEQSMFNIDKNHNKFGPYNVKIAILSKLLSVLRLSKISEIPFDLGMPDSKILPFKNGLFNV